MAIQRHQRNRIIFFAILLMVGAVVFLMTQCIIPGFRTDRCENIPRVPLQREVTLDVWNVFEGAEVYKDIIDRYRQQNSNVTINYVKLEFGEYREKMLEAFAADAGPDIFTIHNTWLPTQREQIAPAPPDSALVTQLESMFPEVVKFDFTRISETGDKFVYAVPIAIETLGLFYNTDYFKAKNIETPPKIWDEVLDYTRLFTQFDEKGNIKISGIPLGAIDNINRSTDILTLLMLQGGTRMNNEPLTEATFDDPVIVSDTDEDKKFSPARDAVEFYLSFSNKTKEFYSWNDSMSYSIDAFVEGRSAMMINYPHHAPTIRRKAPHLNFKLTSMPQLKDRKEDINYANYWGFTVAKDSDEVKEAWKFIEFLMSEESMKNYAEKTRMPVARKDLVLWQQLDDELKHFASQILTAKSWYQGDSDEVERAFRDMVGSIRSGSKTVDSALEDAAAQITIRIKHIREGAGG